MTNDRVAIELKVDKRHGGKHDSRALRKNKFVPGVVYGPKTKSTNLSIDERIVIRYFNHQHENAIFKIISEDPSINNLQVLVKAMTLNPITHRPSHVDLYALDLTKSIRVSVALKFIGTPVGVKENSGIFQPLMREIEIECLPHQIPHEINVDVSHLAINKSVHVSDVQLPAGIKSISSSDLTLATVAPPQEEVAAAPAATAEAGAAAPGAAATPAAGSETAAASGAGASKS